MNDRHENTETGGLTAASHAHGATTSRQTAPHTAMPRTDAGYGAPIAPGPVLILGGTCTLGLTLARRLLGAGLAVALTARDAAGEERVHHALECLGGDYAVLRPVTPESLPERCAATLGCAPRHMVDLMHGRYESLLAAASPQEIDQWACDDIALRARCLRAVSRAMLAARAGRCVFVSSTAASLAAMGQGYYAAAKAAGEALYRSTGLELGRRGVTACTLRLGWLDAGRGAPFIARHGPPQDMTRETTGEPGLGISASIPTGRLVTVDEAVGTLLYLLSDAAISLNGTHLTLDGGFTAGKAASFLAASAP